MLLADEAETREGRVSLCLLEIEMGRLEALDPGIPKLTSSSSRHRTG